MSTVYELSDENFLKCANCGKYKVDASNEEFKIIYRPNGKKEWLCEKCNKFRNVFKDSPFVDLAFIIAPGEKDDEFLVYNKDMYACKG